MTILRALLRLQNRYPTIFYIISKEELFNEFGANHTTEALHLAMIHSMMPAYQVFRSQKLIDRLLDGLFRVSYIPHDWHKYIPKSPNLCVPFEFNESA